MKKSIVLLFTLLLSVVSHTVAQTNSTQRERDIKIAEGIIAEIFGSQHSQNDVWINGSRNRDIHGEYIPGYGVHFTVSPGFASFVGLRNVDSEADEVRVSVQQEGQGSGKESPDEMKEHMMEYLTKYASLISGIPDNETIRITYAPNRSRGVFMVFAGDSRQTVQTAEGFSLWARVFDLKQFRNGKISEQEVRSRIQSHTLDTDQTYTDFNVFASVLETALNSVENEYLRVSGKPRMEYLPGLGVRYGIQVSARPSVIFDELRLSGQNLGFRMDTLRLNLDRSFQLMDESLEPLIVKLDSMTDSDLSEEERSRMQKEFREEQEKVRARQDSLRKSLRTSGSVYSYSYSTDDDGKSGEDIDISGEADAIMEQLKSVLQNYGSTLSSLKNDELLMITLDWTGRSKDLPERTEVRITKADLLKGKAPDIKETKRN